MAAFSVFFVGWVLATFLGLRSPHIVGDFSILIWLSESLLYTSAGVRFNSNIHIFYKGEVNGHHRLGVLLARDVYVEKALEKVERAYAKLDVKL